MIVLMECLTHAQTFKENIYPSNTECMNIWPKLFFQASGQYLEVFAMHGFTVSLPDLAAAEFCFCDEDRCNTPDSELVEAGEYHKSATKITNFWLINWMNRDGDISANVISGNDFSGNIFSANKNCQVRQFGENSISAKKGK